MSSGGSLICDTFVENSWRKDLCSNCFRCEAEHEIAMRAQLGSSRSQPSVTPGLTTATRAALSQNGINSPQKGGTRPVSMVTPVSKVVTGNKMVRGGTTISSNSSNGLNSNHHTKGSVTERAAGSGNPSNASSGKTVATRTITKGSKSQRDSIDLTSKSVKSILKGGKDPVRKKGVVFRDEEQVIGYGGLDDVPEAEDDDGEWDVSEEDFDEGLLEALDSTEQDRQFTKLTRKNTDFNSVNANLLKEQMASTGPKSTLNDSAGVKDKLSKTTDPNVTASKKNSPTNESTERADETMELSRGVGELEIDLDLTRSVTEELDKRLQMMHRAKNRTESNNITSGSSSSNNTTANNNNNSNNVVVQRSHENKKFDYLDSCKDVLTAEDLSLTRHLLIEDTKGDSIDSGAPSSRESSSSPDSMSLKGSERDSASPDSTRSSKSSAYESIYDSVETRSLTQNPTEASATSARTVPPTTATADPNSSSSSNSAHVSTVVVNNSQSSGNSCVDTAELSIANNGLLPCGGPAADIRRGASTGKRPVRQLSHRVVLRTTDSDAVVASNNATTILVQGNTANSTTTTTTSAINNNSNNKKTTTTTATTNCSASNGGGTNSALNAGRNGGNLQNVRGQNQSGLNDLASILHPTSGGSSNEVANRERHGYSDKVSSHTLRISEFAFGSSAGASQTTANLQPARSDSNLLDGSKDNGLTNHHTQQVQSTGYRDSTSGYTGPIRRTAISELHLDQISSSSSLAAAQRTSQSNSQRQLKSLSTATLEQSYGQTEHRSAEKYGTLRRTSRCYEDPKYLAYSAKAKPVQPPVVPPNSYPIRKDIYGTYRAAKKYTAPKIPAGLELSDQEPIYAEPLDHGKPIQLPSDEQRMMSHDNPRGIMLQKNQQQQQPNENIYQEIRGTATLSRKERQLAELALELEKARYHSVPNRRSAPAIAEYASQWDPVNRQFAHDQQRSQQQSLSSYSVNQGSSQSRKSRQAPAIPRTASTAGGSISRAGLFGLKKLLKRGSNKEHDKDEKDDIKAKEREMTKEFTTGAASAKKTWKAELHISQQRSMSRPEILHPSDLERLGDAVIYQAPRMNASKLERFGSVLHGTSEAQFQPLLDMESVPPPPPMRDRPFRDSNDAGTFDAAMGGLSRTHVSISLDQQYRQGNAYLSRPIQNAAQPQVPKRRAKLDYANMEFHNGVRFADDLVQVFRDCQLVNPDTTETRHPSLADYDDADEDNHLCGYDEKIHGDDLDDCDDDTLFYDEYSSNQEQSNADERHERAIESDVVSTASEDNEDVWKNYANIDVSDGSIAHQCAKNLLSSETSGALTPSAQRWNSPEALLSALTDVNHRTLVALLSHVSTCSHGLPVPEIGGCPSSAMTVSGSPMSSTGLSWADFTLTSERVTKGRDISVCRALHSPTGTKVTLMLTPPKALPLADFLLERSVVASNGLQPGHTVLVLPQSQIRTLAEFSVHCDARSALYVMLQLCRDLQSLQSQGVSSVIESEQRILVASWDQLAYLLFMYKKAPIGSSPYHIPLNKFALSILSELELAKKSQPSSPHENDAELSSSFALVADLLRRNELELCQRVIEFNLWQAPRDPLVDHDASSSGLCATASTQDAHGGQHGVDRNSHKDSKSNGITVDDDDIAEALAEALGRWLTLQKGLAVQKNSCVRDPHARAAQSKMAKPATPCSVYLEYQLQFLTTATARSLADTLSVIRRYESTTVNESIGEQGTPRDDNAVEELYADYRFC